MPETLAEIINATTVQELRARASFKWSDPDRLGAGVAEMDFGAAPPILAALERLNGAATFGYLPPALADELFAAVAGFQRRRFGWDFDPALVHDVPDVLKALELAITHYSRPGSPVILPTPAYMPFLTLPGYLNREIIQVPMRDDGVGLFTFDLDGIDAAFRAGGHMLILCNPCNPLGRVITPAEMAQLTAVVDRHGGRVFADEIHAALVYAPATHTPYASTSATAAGHTLTATSASKAWNLPGLKCAQVIVSNAADQDRWRQLNFFATHGASNAGVVANIAACTEGDPWLAEALRYLDDSRQLLARLLARHLPAVRYRPPDGTYLAWLDCSALSLPGSPGVLVKDRGFLTVIDGPECGAGGEGAFRLNFATPQPVLTQMVERIAQALASG
ncbi:MAG TPA: aminotransferase class I/II-fold pyridoxal phosphate-dependent enzyme [Streptosporangiaceae bacterium]